MQAGDKERFKIVIVDDYPDSIYGEINEIRHFLTDRYDLELESVEIKKPSGALDKIDETVDVAIIDKNLGEGDDAAGVKLINDIRSRYRLLDILIYTGGEMKQEDLEAVADYGMVEVVRSRKFVDRLQTLIERNLSKWSDIVFLRGVVISRIIEIEGEINDVLMEVFSPLDENRQKFRNFFLENSHITLFAKERILAKLTGQMELQKLQEYRNLLAHCKRNKDDPNTMVRMGEDQPIDKATIKEIFEKAENFSKCLKSFRPNEI